MTPTEYGEMLARSASPLTEDQVEAAARILVTVELETAA